MAPPPASAHRFALLRRVVLRAAPFELPLLGGWLLLGFGLSRFTTRISDWYVMTDELLYERLALGSSTPTRPCRGCTRFSCRT